ncbi:MAG: hypothetical protein NC328_07095 [Muribaculum sp.]|nr:hypothetical protein [Muribaculum sp.]
MTSPKVLLIADYSNFHFTLAKGLRDLGCEVNVVSDGSAFMQCRHDVDISRRPGKLGGLALFLKMCRIRNLLSGYDFVSLRNPNFLELKPDKSRFFFRRLLKDNRHVFLTDLTTDTPFLDMLEAPDSPLSYSEWFVDGKPNRLRLLDAPQWDGWHAPPMRRLDNEVYDNIDGAVSALYEYHLSLQRRLPPEKIAYGGIPIDVDEINPSFVDTSGKIRFFLGRDYRRKLIKGTDLLEQAARDVMAANPGKVELDIVENVSRTEFFERMRQCNVVLDQIYSYTPATTALEAMAMGIPVVSGAEPEFYEFIGEKESFPIYNAPIELDPLRRLLQSIVADRRRLRENSLAGRDFVRRHNDKSVVAARFLNFWKSRAASKSH